MQTVTARIHARQETGRVTENPVALLLREVKMPKPITHFVVRKQDNGDYKIHVEAGDGEYVGDFTIIVNAPSEGAEVDEIVKQVREQAGRSKWRET